MSRGLTDPFVDDSEEGLPSSNEDIMGVVVSLFMLVEGLHQRLDLMGVPMLPVLEDEVE